MEASLAPFRRCRKCFQSGPEHAPCHDLTVTVITAITNPASLGLDAFERYPPELYEMA